MSNADQILLSESDERFRTLKIGGKWLILSVEGVFSIGKGTDLGFDYSKETLFIYAEQLQISEEFKYKGGVLSTHLVEPVGSTTTVDVSGNNGQSVEKSNLDPNKSPGETGGSGCPGGMLQYYTENLNPDIPYLQLRATGGDGGTGQEGVLKGAGSSQEEQGDVHPSAGGNGGDGGDGGHIEIFIVHPFLRILERLVYIFKETNEQTKKGDLAIVIKDIKTVVALRPIHDKLQQLAASSFPVKELDDKLRSIGFQLQAMVNTWKDDLEIDVQGGRHGTWGDGTPRGKNGNPGHQGSKTLLLTRTTAELAQESFTPFIFVHPAQTSMLLDKTRLMYFSADPINNPSSVTNLAVLLRRLKQRTALFLHLDPNSTFAKHYATHELELGAFNSIETLQNIYHFATHFLDQLSHGLDYFGYDSQHVPLASFLFYKGILDGMIGNFRDIEDSYSTYYKELAENKASMDAIRSAKQQQQRLIDQATNDIRSLRLTILDVGAIIASYQFILPPKRRALLEQLEEIRKDIEEHLYLNIKSFLSSFSMLAFAPESKLLWAALFASTTVSSIIDITNNKGDQVNKDYLIHQLKTIDGSLKSIDEGYNELNNGTLESQDPGAGKMIGLETKILSTLDQFSSQFPKKLDELKTLFTDYISSIIERNNQILKYNAIAILLQKEHKSIADANAKLDSLNESTLKTLSPELPSLTAFVSQMYYASRNTIMQTLDMTARAFGFWALSDNRFLIAEAYGKTPLPLLGHAALAQAQETILNSYKQAVEAFGGDLNPFPENDSIQGIIVELSKLQVSTLAQLGQLIVNVPVPTSEDSIQTNPFYGIANVRLLIVRVWIEGSITSDDELLIDITHTGKETITRTDGVPFSFSHDPRYAQFKYNTKTQQVIWDGHIGWVDTQTNNIYALLGPFTSWQIQVRSKSNHDLDLSKVTSIKMEFRGKKDSQRGQ